MELVGTKGFIVNNSPPAIFIFENKFNQIDFAGVSVANRRD